MRFELHPEARAELRSAALWYDERRSGLGDEFIAEVSGGNPMRVERVERRTKMRDGPAGTPPGDYQLVWC